MAGSVFPRRVQADFGGSTAPVRVINPVARPAAVALVAAGLLALVCPGLLTPRYETNDDVMMTLIASGRTFVDRPDEHLLLSNVLLGLPLSRLYAAAPGVPWYGLLQVATLLSAAGA